MKRPFRPRLAAGLALVPRGSVFPLANERSQQLSQSDELVFRASNKKPDLQGLVRIPPPQAEKSREFRFRNAEVRIPPPQPASLSQTRQI